jgi:4-hydroxybenzoate polyprenyltransferase
MKQKLEDLFYDILDFIFNNKWVSALFFFAICSLISFFILYPINKSLAIGFISGASLTTIYKILKF